MPRIPRHGAGPVGFLVELYGTDFDSRLGGQLLLGQAGCLSCCLEALFACLGFVPFINDYLGEFNFGGLVKRMVRADNPIEWRHFKKVAKT